MKIFRHFRFEAAHRLPHAPTGHRCARMHGHSFRITVYAKGPVQAATGWVMDFGDLQGAMDPLLRRLDHQCLNEIEGLENPTSENLARWIWRNVQPSLPQLCRVVVRETCRSGCIYDGGES